MEAKLYKTDGSVIDVEPKNGSDFSIEELQGFVGGYIEVVDLRDGRFLVCNENGKLIGLYANVEATALLKQVNKYDYIVGDALVCTYEQIK